MWWTHQNSTSVLCCCNIIQLVVEERNFLSHRIIYFSQFMLVVRNYVDEYTLVVQNMWPQTSVFYSRKCVCQFTQSVDFIDLKNPSVYLQFSSKHILPWFLRNCQCSNYGHMKWQTKAVEVTETWTSQTVQTPVLLALLSASLASVWNYNLLIVFWLFYL